MKPKSKIEKELIKKLQGIWDCKDFIVGVISHVKTDVECTFILECIETKRYTTPEQITLLSFNINKYRNYK